MNLNLKIAFSVFLFSPFLISNSSSQPVQSNDDKLNLTDLGRKIENSISFTTTHSNYENIKATTGQKIIVKATLLIINGDTLDIEGINTRGNSTLHFKRKSYSFNLKSRASFRHGQKADSFKKFYILSLSMDKNYCSNRLAFEMMEALKLFDLFYSFCELRINGQSEGIYMVIERPEDWAIKNKNSPVLIRRGFDNNIDKIKTGKKAEIDRTKKYVGIFRQIYRSLNKYHGEELYVTLSNWIDLDVYMKWLAFNFFVRDADYTDEVYFFVDPRTDKFSIIPWDYDDLFLQFHMKEMLKTENFWARSCFFQLKTDWIKR